MQMKPRGRQYVHVWHRVHLNTVKIQRSKKRKILCVLCFISEHWWVPEAKQRAAQVRSAMWETCHFSFLATLTFLFPVHHLMQTARETRPNKKRERERDDETRLWPWEMLWRIGLDGAYTAHRGRLSLLRAATFFMDLNLNAARTLHQATLDLPFAPGKWTPKLWLVALLDPTCKSKLARKGKVPRSCARSPDDPYWKLFPVVQTDVEGMHADVWILGTLWPLNTAGPSELPGKLIHPSKASEQTLPVVKMSAAVGPKIWSGWYLCDPETTGCWLSRLPEPYTVESDTGQYPCKGIRGDSVQCNLNHSERMRSFRDKNYPEPVFAVDETSHTLWCKKRIRLSADHIHGPWREWPADRYKLIYICISLPLHIFHPSLPGRKVPKR